MIRIWNLKVRAGPDLSWILVWCFFHGQLKAGLMKLCPRSIYSDVFVTLLFLGSRLLYSATSWAFRSFLCTYWCLGSESIVGQIGEGFLVSIRPGRVPWHFMTISCLINFAHVCKCLSFICWVELHFSPKKSKTWGFCPPWPNVELIPLMVLRPLAQSERGEWVCLTAAADGQICALFATLLRYTWEEFSTYYTGKLLGWSSSHIPAKMFPWISLADLNHEFLVATRLDIEV